LDIVKMLRRVGARTGAPLCAQRRVPRVPKVGCIQLYAGGLSGDDQRRHDGKGEPVRCGV